MSDLTVNERKDVARTPEIVAAEIRTFSASMLNNAIEIGRRLVEAKEMVPYGEFGAWVARETGYSSSSANNFMRLYNEYGDMQGSLFGASLADPQTYGKLTVSKALELLALPAGEREEFVTENNVKEMSTRELRAAIRERDEAKKALQTSEARLADAQRTLSDSDKQITDLRQRLQEAQEDVKAADDQATENERALKAKIAELESRPVEVAVAEPDPAEIERRAAAMIEEAKGVAEAKVKTLEAEARAAEAEHEKRLKEMQDKAKAEREKLQAKLKKAEEKAAAAEKQGAEDVAPYKAEAEELRKKLALSGEEMVVFKLRFAAWQEAYRAMEAALDKLPEEQQEKCRAASKAQAERWVNT